MRRLGVAGVAALTAAVLLAACSQPKATVLQTGVSPSATAPAANDALPSAVPGDELSPSSSGAKPSKKPTPSASITPVKDLAYYLARLPRFGPPIAPEPQDVNAGESSPVWVKVPTTQPVAFLTIDDGMVRHPMALPLLKASGIRVTLFLTLNYAERDPDYFRALQNAGAVIENHTITHTSLRGKSYEFQKHEICYTADRFAQLFGHRPTLFRPPYGDYDATTLKVARECGQKVVVYWSETVDKGIVRYQTSHHTIQPGHIVLMHFRQAFGDDFTAALIRMKASGVRPALLEDYVKGACANDCLP
jgi:peptidoglycan/xylan/chitin deacetylase (PgdA/CDA1 family)